MLSHLKQHALGLLAWLGDEAHRRAFAGAAAALLAYFVHEEIDSNLVDAALIVAVPMLTAAWSSTTPQVDHD